MSKGLDRLVVKAALTNDATLERMIDELSMEERQTLESKATHLACRLLRLSGYLNFRGASGCGDHYHDQALHAAYKKYIKARKHAGYSYP